MARRSEPTITTWSPRQNLPGQLDLLPALDADLVRQREEAHAARFGIGANGGPPLDDDDEPPVPLAARPPSFADLERIGRTVFGNLWEGKLAEKVSEDPRTLRRWRAGEGAPSARTVATARAWAVELAVEVLRAAGEPDLAEPLQAHLGRVRRAAQERGRERLRAGLAAASAARASVR